MDDLKKFIKWYKKLIEGSREDPPPEVWNKLPKHGYISKTKCIEGQMKKSLLLLVFVPVQLFAQCSWSKQEIDGVAGTSSRIRLH